MSRLPPAPRERPWLRPGDAAETLACLAEMMEAGRIDPIDQIRAIWWLRSFTDACGPHPEAHALRDRIDPHGRVPAPPGIVALRFWIEAHVRNLPWGTLGRLARQAGLHHADVSRFRNGGSLTTEKVERLSAALIAAGHYGASSNRKPNRDNPLKNPPRKKEGIC